MTGNVEEERLIESGELALCGGAEQFVGHVHEDAMVPDGMLGEDALEFVGHESRVASGLKEVVETRAEL